MGGASLRWPVRWLGQAGCLIAGGDCDVMATNNSQLGGFEELCSHLARLEIPAGDPPW